MSEPTIKQDTNTTSVQSRRSSFRPVAIATNPPPNKQPSASATTMDDMFLYVIPLWAIVFFLIFWTVSAWLPFFIPLR